MDGLKSGTSLQGGKYKIERLLGKGSFGITYLATTLITTDSTFGKVNVEVKVAIKEFFMSEVNSRKADGSTVEGSTGGVFADYRKKFRREAENLSKLSHPNIVKVYDVFDENNTTYYVMEYMDGGSLDEYIARQGHLTEAEVLDCTRKIGQALDYMHQHKMLHLDLKPKNVMRSNDGEIKLIDFGLSKQYNENGEPESSTTVGKGTPGYAPTEQADYQDGKGFPVTMDVYALGATMMKMVTGHTPPTASAILNNGFPRHELTNHISAAIIDIIEKAMSPRKDDRYQSAKELLTACKKINTCNDDTDFSISIDDTLLDEKDIKITTPPTQQKQNVKKVKNNDMLVDSRIHGFTKFAVKWTAVLNFWWLVATWYVFFTNNYDFGILSGAVFISALFWEQIQLTRNKFSSIPAIIFFSIVSIICSYGILSLILLFLCFIIILIELLSLFIKKNGKSAWQLMLEERKMKKQTKNRE